MNDDNPVMVLPEPARRVWLGTRDLIKEGIGRVQDGPAEYAIGGGTVLAARHRHRRSTDIDIQTPTRRGSVEDLHGPEHADLRTALKARGWTVPKTDKFDFFSAEAGRDPENRRNVEIWTHEMPIRKGLATASIDGETERVQSDAQILSGKTRRFARNVPRDIFDVVVLGKLNPAAVEAAVNIIYPKELPDLAKRWAVNNAEIAKKAADRIKGAPREFEAEIPRLGTAGAETLRDAVYALLRIEVDGGRLVVTTKSALAGLRTAEAGAGDVDALLSERGLDHRIDGQGLITTEIAGYAEALIGRGTGAILYEEVDGRKTRWQFRDRGPASPRRSRAAETDVRSEFIPGNKVDHPTESHPTRGANEGPGGASEPEHHTKSTPQKPGPHHR